MPTANTHRPLQRIAALLWPALLVGYFALAAYCTAVDRPWPAAILLAAILALALVRAVVTGARGSAVFVAFNLVLVVAVLATAGPHDALSLTVVIVQALVSALFFRSLMSGRTDLITQIATAIRHTRSPRELAYTRGVCLAWGWFMAALSATSLACTFAAPPALWWWWENVMTLALPVAFFAAEWLVRQWVLRGEEKTGLHQSLRALLRIDYQRLFQV